MTRQQVLLEIMMMSRDWGFDFPFESLEAHLAQYSEIKIRGMPLGDLHRLLQELHEEVRILKFLTPKQREQKLLLQNPAKEAKRPNRWPKALQWLRIPKRSSKEPRRSCIRR